MFTGIVTGLGSVRSITPSGTREASGRVQIET